MRTGTDPWGAWCELFDDVADALFQSHHIRWMWRVLNSIIDSSEVRRHAIVTAYLQTTYAAYAANYVRREVDMRKDSRSLYRCLNFLASKPETVSRASFTEAIQVTYEEDREGVSRWFDEFAPDGGAILHVPTIRADMMHLREAAQRVKEFVDTNIAHRGNAPTSPITFDDIDSAMSEIEAISKKYYRLRYPGTSLWTATPVVDLEFLRMFETAWFPPGSTLPVEFG